MEGGSNKSFSRANNETGPVRKCRDLLSLNCEIRERRGKNVDIISIAFVGDRVLAREKVRIRLEARGGITAVTLTEPCEKRLNIQDEKERRESVTLNRATRER